LQEPTHDADDIDRPLPGTLKFVFIMGSLYLIGWLLMFWLLKARF
jgi:hypothetical protein